MWFIRKRKEKKRKESYFFVILHLPGARPLFLTYDDICLCPKTISLITAPPIGLIDEQHHLLDKSNTFNPTFLFRFYQMHTNTDVPVLEQYYFWQWNSKDI